MSEVISVLTYKSVDRILGVGGTQSWRLNRDRALKCEYVVVCRNANSADAEGPEPHGMAFIVGRIKDIIPSTEKEGRWLITISEYCCPDVPDQWEGRYPVAYWQENEFDFDFSKLKFKPLEVKPAGLTISQAKAGLAIGLNVPETAIEIVVRS